jgi:hypothetical protein
VLSRTPLKRTCFVISLFLAPPDDQEALQHPGSSHPLIRHNPTSHALRTSSPATAHSELHMAMQPLEFVLWPNERPGIVPRRRWATVKMAEREFLGAYGMDGTLCAWSQSPFIWLSSPQYGIETASWLSLVVDGVETWEWRTMAFG